MYDCQSGIDVTTNKANSVVKKVERRIQFHQHFTRGFFVRKFCAKLFCTYILGLNFFWRKNIGANAHIKCWWNWPKIKVFFSQHRFFQLRKSIANDFRVRLTWFNADSWLNLQRNLNENLLIFLNHLITTVF